MTDKNLTEIVVILDRSGSMSSIRQDTIGGFNTFLAEQKKGTGKARISLIQFDDKYQIDYDGLDINDAPDLTNDTYVPRGSTALMDAVGKTVVTVGERLAKQEEHQRPGQVIVLIITDGAENASSEYLADKVREMVKHQTEVYNWTFVFMGGGDLNAQTAQAHSAGMVASNTYGYTDNNVPGVYTTISRGIARRRDAVAAGIVVSAAAAVLTDEEKLELVQP